MVYGFVMALWVIMWCMVIELNLCIEFVLKCDL